MSLAVVLSVFPATKVAHANGGFAYSPWNYVTTPGNNPLPWVGTCLTPPLNCGATGPLTQNIMDLHCNWHCTKANPFFCQSTSICNGSNATEDNWGNDFVGFHRQLLLDYELWRRALNGPRIQPFDAEPTGIIPGDDENTTSDFTKCLTGPANAVTRSAGAVCATCQTIPPCLVGDANLSAFANIGAIGSEMMCSNYHNQGHIGIGNARNTSIYACPDFFSFRTALRDPAFWASHQHIDDVARDWQRLQAADVVIVMDVSGSMNDNCPAGSNNDCVAGSLSVSPCKINDARSAAKMFADLVQDDRPGSTAEHTIGVVAFSTFSTSVLPLTPAAAIVGDPNNPNDSAFDTALNGMVACGLTGIGNALLTANSMLSAGSNPHKAILLLTDGLENIQPYIKDVQSSIGPEVVICAIGYGSDWADNEDALRNLCEDHGGVFIADPDLSPSGITLQKFFVDCFGQIYDSAISQDPLIQIPAGAASSEPVAIDVCATDSKLSVVGAFDNSGALAQAGVSLVVTTPANDLVLPTGGDVEASDGQNWSFAHIGLPYAQHAHAGQWTAQFVRTQRIYTNLVSTDAYVDRVAGRDLVRNEIHRLYPRGCNRVLYYEDGRHGPFSAYRDALDAEQAAGAIPGYTEATSAADFQTRLLDRWDLIVFARQSDPTAQIYDGRLQTAICEGQKAILTDFYLPAGGINPVLACAGVYLDSNGDRDYASLDGDGRLLTGSLSLTNRGYAGNFAMSAQLVAGGAPWLAQGYGPQGSFAIVGNGSTAGAQSLFYSVLTRGSGRIEPYPGTPRYVVGQNLTASFHMGRVYVPDGGWDAVTATVTLDRPGSGPLETYTLFDDGTNGDKIAGNHVWEVEIPTPATAAGPHTFSATFLLTKDGCTIRREAEYSTVVTPSTAPCSIAPVCAPDYVGGAGEAVALGTCFLNDCPSPRSYTITVSDTKGWLCEVDDQGTPSPLPDGVTLTTATLPALGSLCVSQLQNLSICIPEDVGEAESTIVTVSIHSSADQTVTCTRTVTGTRAVSSIDEQQVPSNISIKGLWDPSLHVARFYAAMPAQGHTTLRVFDLSGRLVATPVERDLGAGMHTFRWDGTVSGTGQRAASGFYVYRLRVGDQEAAGSLIIAR